MSAPQQSSSIDSLHTDSACVECGQHFAFCKSCHAPIEEKRKGPALAFIGLAFAGLCLTALYVGAYVIFARDPSLLGPYLGAAPSSTWTVLSSMGEMFGGLNCIVSALAFAALIYSISQQRRELRYQRQSMGESRREMHLSIEAQIDSARSLSKQIEHMRQTEIIDGLGSMLRSFDAQIASSVTAIQELEATTGDASTLTDERLRLQKLRQSRNTTIQKLDDAINSAPQPAANSQYELHN